MIQFGEDKYIPELKKLWRLCFPEDTEYFVNLYFDKVYTNENTLIFLENDKPVASFQMIPYPIKNNDQIKLAGYISGTMTHPDYRRKGIMSRMLKYSFDAMREKGYDFSFLIPQEGWLFEYYSRFGYEEAFPNSFVSPALFEASSSQEVILRDKTIRIYTRPEEIDLSDFFAVYSRFLMENNPVVLKTKKQVAIILDDFFDEKGVLFSNDWGIAFCSGNKEEVFVKEFFYFDTEMEGHFLSAITGYFQTKNLLIQKYSASPSATCLGMIKKLTNSVHIPVDLYMSMMLD
jgi:Predicted acetyltransferase involved in intracellular survival and related acetyltransferases